ncbi:hypothetical protein DXG01_002803 [Tephrocybe rancida]|nr:hypothetical protein DXG01_002803 [Tephrocybe rancida]
MITEEYECHALRSKGVKEENAAFFAGEKGCDGGGGSKKDIKCFNCHKKSHYKANCWALNGRKEGQRFKKKDQLSDKGKEKKIVVNVKSKDNKGQEAWMAIMESNIEGFIKEGLNDVFAGLTDDDIDREASSMDTNESLSGYLVDIELFNSNTFHHMSGLHHCFINYEPITPKLITTANRYLFNTIGKGDMYINVPNAQETPLHTLLEDVLYALTMGLTLISV